MGQNKSFENSEDRAGWEHAPVALMWIGRVEPVRSLSGREVAHLAPVERSSSEAVPAGYTTIHLRAPTHAASPAKLQALFS